jgi:hypothetical protein
MCIPRNSSLIHKHSILFPLSHDTTSYPRLDHQYPHIVLTLVWQVFSTLDQVGPEYLSFTWMDISRSWCTCLNLVLWHTQETPFQSPSYMMTVDAIKGASRCSDYIVTSWSKELITLFLSYMQCWTFDWSICIKSALSVFPSWPT